MIYMQLIMLLIVVACVAYITKFIKNVYNHVEEQSVIVREIHDAITNYRSDTTNILGVSKAVHENIEFLRKELVKANNNIIYNSKDVIDIKNSFKLSDLQYLSQQINDIKTNVAKLTLENNTYTSTTENVKSTVELIAKNSEQLLKSLTALEVIKAKKTSSTRKKSTLKFEANTEPPRD